MADQIKKIAKFSEDTIELGLNSLTKEQRDSLTAGLDIISSNLGEKKERKVESKTFDTTDEVIFREHILPQISRRVIEAEKHEIKTALSIVVDYRIKTNYKSLSIEEMLKEHVTIVQTEEGLKAMVLIAQFSRGLLYLNLAEKLRQTGSNLREFVQKDNLSVAYTTILRYMTLATMILKYPRLLLCQLNFTQLMKHKTRLLNFLGKKEGHELNCRLSIPFEIIANGQKVQICHEELVVPTERFDADVDWAFHDLYTTPKTSDEKVLEVLEARKNNVDEEEELNKTM